MRLQYKYAVALTAALGLFMAVLDNTIVNVALSPLVKAFNTDLSSVQWVVTAYFLAQAAVIPAAGYLSNRIGIKKVYLTCLALFTLGSVLCGLSDLVQDANGHPYIGLLIFFRVVQGIGGGALFPLATAISFSAFPPEERASSSAIIGIPVLMAPAFGPTIGGLLIDSLGWQWIFFINLPVGLIALFLVWRVIKPDTNQAPQGAQGRFDVLGLILSMAGVLAVVYGFTMVSERNPDTISATNPQGDVYGWGYGMVWLLVGIGTALLVAFALWELRVKDPVMDLRLFKNRDFTTSSILTWLMTAFIFGSFFLLPVFLQNIRDPHYGATVAGLTTMPMGLAAAAATMLGGRVLYNKLGPRYLVMLGFIFLAASNLLLLGISNETTGWDLVPAMLLRGLGFGMTGIPLQTLALATVTGRALPKASSLYNVTRQIFSSVGIAILSTLFIQQTTAHLPSQQVIQQEIAAPVQQQKVAEFLAAHPGLTPQTIQTSPDFGALQQQIKDAVAAKVTARAGVPALDDVFTIVLVAMAFLILLVFILPRRISTAQAPAGEGEAEQPRVMVME
jgi:EmrB/QacA subfamily drug resistance transporter